MLTVGPSPVPYPVSPTNGVVDSWSCTDTYSPSPIALPSPTTTSLRVGEDCAVSHYSAVYPQSINATAVAAPVPTPFPNGYAPGDTGNWDNIGPWFAAFIAAAVLGPFALLTVLRWIREHWTKI